LPVFPASAGIFYVLQSVSQCFSEAIRALKERFPVQCFLRTRSAFVAILFLLLFRCDSKHMRQLS
jgi:hypothetical protein